MRQDFADEGIGASRQPLATRGADYELCADRPSHALQSLTRTLEPALKRELIHGADEDTVCIGLAHKVRGFFDARREGLLDQDMHAA